MPKDPLGRTTRFYTAGPSASPGLADRLAFCNESVRAQRGSSRRLDQNPKSGGTTWSEGVELVEGSI
jgi:hypothetical protein